MKLIGLTGGIGSGKSSASERLAEHGAVIIDADAIVKDLQQPGQPVFVAMVERWGDKIVAEDGTLNRPAVADIVFSDSAELEAINKIVHPAVRTETERRIREAVETDKASGSQTFVILDNPLLIESIKKAEEKAAAAENEEKTAENEEKTAETEQDSATEDAAAPAGEGSAPTPEHIIIVDCSTELAVERLVAHRGFSVEDAEARIAAQVSREERLSYADFVIDNNGDLEHLTAEIDRCQAWLVSLS